jgi:hypothetical protein
MDARSIALKISESFLSNYVFHVVLLVLQRKLLGFKNVVLRLGFDLQFSSFTLSGVSVNTVHYAGSNNPHIERKDIERRKL